MSDEEKKHEEPKVEEVITVPAVIKFPTPPPAAEEDEDEGEELADPIPYLLFLEDAPGTPVPFLDRRELTQLIHDLAVAKGSKKGIGFFVTDTGAWHAQDVRGLSMDLEGEDDGDDDEPGIGVELPDGISFSRGPS